MTIRTPEDEVDKPGHYLPPFREGWNYQGATYPGHSDFAVDFNRRTTSGGWLQDEGDPVLAAAGGTVAEVDKGDGLVILSHWGGRYRSEYRHMRSIPVKVGDKVQRGDRVGNIGNVAGDGRSFGAHLHHVQYRKVDGVWKRVRMTFEDRPVATSIGDSDTQPTTWQPPAPVNVVGPPPKATWEGAFKEAAKALEDMTGKRDGWKAQAALLKEERDEARKLAEQLNVALSQSTADHDAMVLRALKAEADLATCRAATPIDCTAQLAAQRASLLAAVRNGVGALVDGLEAEG